MHHVKYVLSPMWIATIYISMYSLVRTSILHERVLVRSCSISVKSNGPGQTQGLILNMPYKIEDERLSPDRSK